MADIQVRSAFVDKVLVGTDGAWGLKTSEPHSRKNDTGGYDTTGRTFRTIRGKNIDWTHFQEKDRISFFGREETVEREHEGKKYYDLFVWVDGVTVLRSGNQPVPQRAEQPTNPNTEPWDSPTNLAANPWATPAVVSEDVPF